MTKSEQIQIERLISLEELDRKIKSLEKNTRVLKRLYFIKFRYQGDSVEKACEKVGVTRMVGYHWQERWNQQGYEGIIPRFGGGRPSKLTKEQKEQILELLRERENWTTEEVRQLIISKCGVEYTLKQIRIILKKIGMHYGKPFPKDHRRPKNAEEILKKTTPSN